MNIKPVFIEKPWGGTYISECFNLPIKRMIGEAFLVSTLENQENTTEEGPLSARFGRIPFLIKMIDANDNLSIQVHPNDEIAANLERSSGKTECWYVVDVIDGSGIYYGLKSEITISEFFSAVKSKEDASNLMNFVQVKKNDFIVVPAGIIHAIGSGVRIVEFQQSSGVTYRIWDWNREGRELHLEKAKLSSNTTQPAPIIYDFEKIECGNFFSHPDFSLDKISNEVIKCSSEKTNIAVNFDLKTFNFSLYK